MSGLSPQFTPAGVAFLSAGPLTAGAPARAANRSVVWHAPLQPAPPHGAWPLRVAGDVISGGDEEGTLSAVERLRRQRLRQRGAGVLSFAAAVDGRFFFIQQGDLYAAPASGDGDAAAGAAQLIVAHGEVRARAGEAAAAGAWPRRATGRTR